MLKKITTTMLSLVVMLLFTSAFMSENGRAGKAGSPGETTCVSCHSDFTANTGGGSVTISGISGGQYTPGTTYNMSVTVAKSGVSLFGLGCEAMTSTNNNAGTLVITNSAQTKLLSSTVGGTSSDPPAERRVNSQLSHV